MDELKLCPFCGGKAYLRRLIKENELAVLIACSGCEAEMWFIWDHGKGKEAVVNLWNTRVNEKELQDETTNKS